MHTVEKIGGTSMSQFATVMKNVIIADYEGDALYNRIFVVSAYGGITNLLLEHKKSGQPGVYAYYAEQNPKWQDALKDVETEMCRINAGFADTGLDVDDADSFVKQRLEGIRNCLEDLSRLHTYGHFQVEAQLGAVREMLSAVGEAHSARNSAMILQKHGVNAAFADLTGWKETKTLALDEKIKTTFAEYDLNTTMPIATGYTKCLEGIMTTFDRGYSEITFSKIAVLTGAKEGIIHKEFHLSSGDPNLIGVDKVEVIGYTNYDVADQLADLGMEAIHPKASKGMEFKEIPIRVKNAFDPKHEGTLICHDYRSKNPRVEMITGRKNIIALELWDSAMVGQSGYDYKLLEHLSKHKVSYIAKNTNANTITHYVPKSSKNLDKCIADIKAAFPNAKFRTEGVAIVSAIGSNMNVPGFLSMAAEALASADINILAMDQCMRQVNMQFIICENDFDKAIAALHKGLVEENLNQ